MNSAKNIHIGIDTSCYTTSIAALDNKGNVVADLRKLLEIPLGKRGLRQSEMVFQHNKNLPLLFAELGNLFAHENAKIRSIAVSRTPRSSEESYMPAFTVGCGYAQTLAAVLNIPLHYISHQENHMWAALMSDGTQLQDVFLFLHISGGTTELLVVKQKECKVFDIQPLVITKDLSVGQFIDRVGVALGLPFPCGQHLAQKACLGHAEPVSLPSAFMHKGFFSFSGVESCVQRMIAKNVDICNLAAGVELCVAKSIKDALQYVLKTAFYNNIVVVGGVSANIFLRSYLEKFLAEKVNLVFPDSKYSTDNAVGAAYAAYITYNN